MRMKDVEDRGTNTQSSCRHFLSETTKILTQTTFTSQARTNLRAEPFLSEDRSCFPARTDARLKLCNVWATPGLTRHCSAEVRTAQTDETFVLNFCFSVVSSWGRCSAFFALHGNCTSTQPLRSCLRGSFFFFRRNSPCFFSFVGQTKKKLTRVNTNQHKTPISLFCITCNARVFCCPRGVWGGSRRLAENMERAFFSGSFAFYCCLREEQARIKDCRWPCIERPNWEKVKDCLMCVVTVCSCLWRDDDLLSSQSSYQEAAAFIGWLPFSQSLSSFLLALVESELNWANCICGSRPVWRWVAFLIAFWWLQTSGGTLQKTFPSSLSGWARALSAIWRPSVGARWTAIKNHHLLSKFIVQKLLLHETKAHFSHCTVGDYLILKTSVFYHGLDHADMTAAGVEGLHCRYQGCCRCLCTKYPVWPSTGMCGSPSRVALLYMTVKPQ